MSADRQSFGFPASILYSSARDMERVRDARRHDADLFLVDLEDSVPDAERAAARRSVAEYLDWQPDLDRTAVRINPLGTSCSDEDIAMLTDRRSKPGYVFMTMVNTRAEVEDLRSALQDQGWSPRVYATIETLAAVRCLFDIAQALDGMILGSADLAASIGVDISLEALRSARQSMVLACAEHDVACIDTGNFRLGDLGALEREIAEAKSLGFHGKGTVHPKELKAINRAFRPCESELSHARRILQAYDDAKGGVCVLDGSMIGPPFVRLAQARIRRAESWRSDFTDMTNRTDAP